MLTGVSTYISGVHSFPRTSFIFFVANFSCEKSEKSPQAQKISQSFIRKRWGKEIVDLKELKFESYQKFKAHQTFFAITVTTSEVRISLFFSTQKIKFLCRTFHQTATFPSTSALPGPAVIARSSQQHGN